MIGWEWRQLSGVPKLKNHVILIFYQIVSSGEKSVTSSMSSQENGRNLSPELELFANESSISSNKMQHSGTDESKYSDRFQEDVATFKERVHGIGGRLSGYFHDFQAKSSHRK